MSQKVYNFNAGPAMLPEDVMQQARAEFLDWHGTGMSVMEISHRSDEFIAIAQESEKDLREILNIPSNYHVLFLHGGGRSQFAMVPMNLIGQYKKAAYIQTGIWGKLSIEEARRFCAVDIIADAEPTRFTTIPDISTWKSLDAAAYLSYVDNETVNGVEFPFVPNIREDVPLVCDMSSNILSREIDISKFGLIYACAQKNMGIAGVTIVILRDDLLQREPMQPIPSMFEYRQHVDKESMLNTPPVYPWYMAGLIFKWMKAQGGVAALEKRNAHKAKKLYDYLEKTSFYSNPVEPRYRSRMNVIFTLPTKELDDHFVQEADKIGLNGLRGHRYLGGIRVSMYNAMPEAGIDALIAFMEDFETRYANKQPALNSHDHPIV